MADTSEHAERTTARWDPAPDHVAYRVCRENIIGLLRERPEAADLPVPACPGWTVRDVVAHLNEVCEAARGSLGSLPTERPGGPRRLGPSGQPEPSGQSGQPEPSGQSVDEPGLPELLDAWTHSGLATEELLAVSEHWHGPLTMDVFAHELDIRRVLDVPAPTDHPGYPGALAVVLGGLSRSVEARKLPALRIEAPGAHWVAGAGEPVATVRAGRYDLFRSAAGRRTPQQIAELSWTAPCETWLPAFTWGPFRPPAQATESVIGTLQ